MSSSESDQLTPTNITEAANVATLNLIPEKSKDKYNIAYKLFCDWQNKKQTNSFSENVLLAYFDELSKKYKASTLWGQYSMLRTTLNINNNVEITNYARLRAFLKRKSHGYRPKKSKTFTSQEINKFIKEAPDSEHLLAKVVLIMGIMGACRRNELYKMDITDFQDLGSSILVNIPDTKTAVARMFTITGHFYEIIKKYADLRPQNAKQTCFFLNYQKGKCTVQKVGINKFGNFGKHIASFLNLPNPELYTGHCFRRSSATILVNSGEDITSLKRHGGWKSTTVAEQYIDESVSNKLIVGNKLVEAIINAPSTSTSINLELDNTKQIQKNNSEEKMMVFHNCTNLTFNINNYTSK